MAVSSPRPSCWKRLRSFTRTSSVTRSKAWNRRSSTTTKYWAKTCASGARRNATDCRGTARRAPTCSRTHSNVGRPLMYLIKKGNVPNQAHVGIPEGLYEEEHGRRGFVGPASHLYRRHPPTGWVRIDGPLRPRAFACADLPTPDLRAADARPVEI